MVKKPTNCLSEPKKSNTFAHSYNQKTTVSNTMSPRSQYFFYYYFYFATR